MENLSKEYKKRIVEAVKANSFKYKTNKLHATNLRINPAQFSRIVKGDIEGVLSDDNWRYIAHKYNVSKDLNSFKYNIAPTKIFNYITTQLESCQAMGISAMFCDYSDIGKTVAAKHYVATHSNAFRVDCSLNPSRTELLRALALELGLDNQISPRLLQRKVIEYINTLDSAIVIWDEFGDLHYPAFMLTKALWNGTEGRCAWFAMGAEGLQVKFENNYNRKKIGFAEIFRRYGSKYQNDVPADSKARQKYIIDEIARILKVNKSKRTPLQMYAVTGGSLTRVNIELRKEHKKQNETEAAV